MNALAAETALLLDTQHILSVTMFSAGCRKERHQRNEFTFTSESDAFYNAWAELDVMHTCQTPLGILCFLSASTREGGDAKV